MHALLLTCIRFLDSLCIHFSCTLHPHTHTQSYPLAELRVLVEAATRQRLDDYQFQSVQRKPLDENRHGRRLTLGHYNIKTGDTLFLMKIGFSLEITNPQVGRFLLCMNILQ